MNDTERREAIAIELRTAHDALDRARTLALDLTGSADLVDRIEYADDRVGGAEYGLDRLPEVTR